MIFESIYLIVLDSIALINCISNIGKIMLIGVYSFIDLFLINAQYDILVPLSSVVILTFDKLKECFHGTFNQVALALQVFVILPGRPEQRATS